MDVWLIILLSVVGGLLLLVFIVLTVWMLCRKRKRSKSLNTLHKEQNGNVWQVHDYVVEVDDEESPSNHLSEDGLCKETISGSTFPRRAKKEEQLEPEEDGLCKDTKVRSTTFTRRPKLEDTLLKPVENGGHSVSDTVLKSVLPVGALVPKIGSQEKLDLSKPEKKPVITDTAAHGTIANGDVTMKDHPSEDDTTSSSSSSSQESETILLKEENPNLRKLVVGMKRSKSFSRVLDEVPEYTKPVKRTVSNPSLVAREHLIKADKRFESLQTWKESFPIPEPDYPSARYPTLTPKHTDDNVHVPLSNATSDYDVEMIESIPGCDDESKLTRSDGAPESPGITMPQMEKQHNEEVSFLSKELRSITSIETKDHTSFVDGQKNDYNVIINSDDTSSAFQKETVFPPHEVKVNNLTNSIPDYPVVTESKGFLQHQNTTITTEKKQTTSSWSTDAQPVEFRSVKLKPAAWKTYDTSQDLASVNITTQGPTASPTEDAKRVLPSSLTESLFSEQSNQLATDPSKVTSTSYTTKKTTVNYETSVTRKNYTEPTLNNQVDFRAFKLRPTPDNIKQHIGFKEEIQPTHSEKNQAKESGDAAKKKAEKTISTQDSGIKLSNLPIRLNSEVRDKPSFSQNASLKTNRTIGNNDAINNSNKSSDMVIIRLNEQKPTPDMPVAASNESTLKSPRRQTAPGTTQSEEEKKKTWRREQIEQRLSTGLAMNERQPIMQASGLAYRSCMPELFTKIKEMGDQKEVKAN